MNKNVTYMEAKGKIIAKLEERSGVAKSSGKPFRVAQYVIETHENFPKKIMFEVFGEDRINNFNIQVGEMLTVQFDVDAREYNGKWYNSVRAFNVVRDSDATPATDKETNDFPFGEINGADDEPPF